jgi:ABC-type transporter Mla MlaB component
MQAAVGTDEQPSLGQQTFRLVEDLQNFGINVSDIKKLQEAGLVTIGSVLQTCSRDLIAIKGLSEAKIEKVGA